MKYEWREHRVLFVGPVVLRELVHDKQAVARVERIRGGWRASLTAGLRQSRTFKDLPVAKSWAEMAARNLAN